jgi:hypothetical protein
LKTRPQSDKDEMFLFFSFSPSFSESIFSRDFPFVFITNERNRVVFSNIDGSLEVHALVNRRIMPRTALLRGLISDAERRSFFLSLLSLPYDGFATQKDE